MKGLALHIECDYLSKVTVVDDHNRIECKRELQFAFRVKASSRRQQTRKGDLHPQPGRVLIHQNFFDLIHVTTILRGRAWYIWTIVQHTHEQSVVEDMKLGISGSGLMSKCKHFTPFILLKAVAENKTGPPCKIKGNCVEFPLEEDC